MLGDAAPPASPGQHPNDHLVEVISLLEKLSVDGETVPRTANPGAAPNRSFLIKVYLAASRILSGQSVSSREVSLLFSENSMQSHAVTQYDLARYRELRNFCLERRSTGGRSLLIE